MTEFQRELLKEREKISFHYEKSDINIQLKEEKENNVLKKILYIQLEFLYFFDSSLINPEELKQDFLEKNIQEASQFTFPATKEDFSFNHRVTFRISLEELQKNEHLRDLSIEEIEIYMKEKVLSKEFKDIIFNIGFVEAISYYKVFPVQNFIVIGELEDYQKQWWSKLIFNGLGEYRYLNNLLSIDQDQFVNIIANPKLEEYYEEKEKYKYLDIEKQGFLIPIGGGKDSVVTLELLSKFKNENTLFAVDHKGARRRTAEVAGYNIDEVVQIERIFDPKLNLRNSQGFFNGHVPFSASLAFLALLSAYILNKKYIPLSNESSANEPTVIDLDINHQYSKAIEFETDFREYIEFLDLDIEYFSLLRPLTEVGIVRIFTRYEKYFHAFNSCNVGSKGDEWTWCCNCSKCLFAFIILSPFLYKDKLVEIFGCDVFENESLLEDMYKLIGKRDAKPFECVGTLVETRFSLNKLMEKLQISENTNESAKKEKQKKLPILLEKYKDIYLSETSRKKSKLEERSEKDISKIDENKNLYLIYNQDNFLPDFLEEIVKKAIKGEE